MTDESIKQKILHITGIAGQDGACLFSAFEKDSIVQCVILNTTMFGYK